MKYEGYIDISNLAEPCPFCGNSEIYLEGNTTDNRTVWGKIICGSCNAKPFLTKVSEGGNYINSETQVRSNLRWFMENGNFQSFLHKWNKRA